MNAVASSPFLSAADKDTLENSRLSSLQEATFTGTCYIATPSLTVDSMGGHTTIWQTSMTATPCCLTAKPGNAEQEEAGKVTDVSEFILHLPHGTSISHEKRVVIGSSTYEILAILNPVTNQVAITCLVAELS